MLDLLGTGTNRGHSMIGLGVGLGLSEFRLKSAPFSVPERIQGLQLWLDSSDSSTIKQSDGGVDSINDGDPVGYWKDKSGNQRHLTQPDGTLKPVLKTGIQNSKNGIRFDGVNDFLGIISANGLYVDISNSMSAFLVIRSSNFAQNYKKVYSYGSSGSHGIGTFSTTRRLYTDAGATSSATALTDNVAALVGLTFSGSSVFIYKNGVLDGTGTRAANTDTSGNLYLGATTNGTIRDFFDFDIFEFILYIGAISAQQRQDIEAYLREKWGTP